VFKSVKEFVHYAVYKTESHKGSGLDAIIPFAQRIQAGFFYYWYIKNIEKPPKIGVSYAISGDTLIPISEESEEPLIVYTDSITIKGTIIDSLLHDCKMRGKIC
jgi:hypothetical protein